MRALSVVDVEPVVASVRITVELDDPADVISSPIASEASSSDVHADELADTRAELREDASDASELERARRAARRWSMTHAAA